MKKYLYIIWALLLVIILGATGLFVAKKVFIPKEIHVHAGFVVFENDKKKDFSSAQYMNIKPCRKDTSKKEEMVSDNDMQMEKAHLHDYAGDVVHVEREGAKWKDVFTNIHYEINYTNASAYINGKEINNFQNQIIHPYDSLIVFVGKNDIQKHLSEGVTKQHIQLEEKKSEDCAM